MKFLMLLIMKEGWMLTGKLIKLILGAVFVVLGIWTFVIWWGDVLSLVRGSLGFFLILLGLIFFAVLD